MISPGHPLDLGQTGRRANALGRRYWKVGEVARPVFLSLGIADQDRSVREAQALSWEKLSEGRTSRTPVTSGTQVVLSKNWMKGGIRWMGYPGDEFHGMRHCVARMLCVLRVSSSLTQNTCGRGRVSPRPSPLQAVAVPHLSTAMPGHWLHSRAGSGCGSGRGPLRGQYVSCS